MTIVITATACGGSGDIIANNSVPAAAFSVSGIIRLAANIQHDTDNNDPSTPSVRNNSFASAQAVNNTSSINGFLTRSGTGRAGDRFENTSDIDDVYRVSLQQGQVIRMQVVDYTGFTSTNTFSGDLDLELRSITDGSLILISNSTTEFEEIVVPSTAEYYVVAFAFSGSSKYVLDFTNTFSSATPLMFERNINVQSMLPDEAIVKYKPSLQSQVAAKSATSRAFSHSHSDTDRATLVSFAGNQKKFISNLLPGFNQNLFIPREQFDKRQTLRNIKELNLSGTVEYASPNFVRKPFLAPNDEFYDLQWHYNNMQLPLAWNIIESQASLADVVVAVIDTGVFLAHDDLDDVLVNGFDFISNPQRALDGDGIDNNPDDPGDSSVLNQNSSWHGTHVVGTVAAETNNTSGVAGTSWHAQIMPLRVLGDGGGTSFDIQQAIRYAAGLSNDSGTVPSVTADIINLSLGGDGSSADEAALYQELFDLGIIVVAAAGNSNTSTLSFPASYPGVFSVSALDFNNDKAPYSNFGSAIDIAAPGGDSTADRNNDGYQDGVLSTYVDETSGVRQPAFQFLQGTSMASPHVAGMFSLMKSVYPALTASDVDTLLKTGGLTDEAGANGRDDIYGYGIANANKAVQAALALANGGVLPPLPVSITANPRQINIGNANSSSINISNIGGGSPVVDTVLSSEPWLSVTTSSVDAVTGLGDYLLTVDRTGLSDGTYLATIRYEFVSQPDFIVNVSMQVGSFADSTVANISAFLIDVETREVVDVTSTRLNQANQLSYEFTDVIANEYFIAVGTDIDNDNLSCSSGEVCGVYPNLTEIQTVSIDANRNDLDITADILSGINTLNLTNERSSVVSQSISDIRIR